ncbi:MAG: hypothetical protein K9N47_20965 [Prosthecobacter sp.]|uniref:hypothetical protein n=1 Tax=Prosthecobacter sp. TaxID=1965333 RepID=UPI00261DFBC2|nr:hypothetical protein [Prosthecobacter sp.]MCF7788607.1 hypothetical protein [Prosthecobacter sp.]
MRVREVADEEIGLLYRREWLPEPGHLHGKTVWAVWDGRTARYGVHPGCTVSDGLRTSAPELAAELAGVAMPTAVEIAARGMVAFARWAAAGLPVVDEPTRQQRAAACAECPRWDAAARGGLGHCKHPGCGCTHLKWWLATERCPDGRWPA